MAVILLGYFLEVQLNGQGKILIIEDCSAESPETMESRYAVSFVHPELTKHQVEARAIEFYTSFQKISVYHKIKFWNGDALGRKGALDVLDTVHVKPGYLNKQNRQVGGRFNTVLVNDGTGEHTGVTGMLNKIAI
jgi:hypothetical protein